MRLREALSTTLTHPTPENLWNLRAELLEAGVPPGSRILPVIGQYQLFLEQVRTGTASRHYSELASKLDIGSISGVLLERFLEPESARELTLSLLSGILSEGLMVAAWAPSAQAPPGFSTQSSGTGLKRRSRNCRRPSAGDCSTFFSRLSVPRSPPG
jgi:hypothetical protein